ncbi:MAG TPA: DUF2206 domain-containing protein [Candidatus Paceibacterota bacterium]|nr:DUF2206 domain-containing protein [Candidatus Paceibacterota bacterium]
MNIRTRHIAIWSAVWMALTTIVVLIPNISPLVATPAILIAAIIVPGLLLSIALKVPDENRGEYIFYSLGLGLFFLLVYGLLIDMALPYFGIAHPLAALPLMTCIDIAVLLLAFRAYVFNKDRVFSWPLSLPNDTNLILGAIPFLFVALSVMGVEVLNNGGGGAITIAMLFSIALYAVVLMIFNRRISAWVYAIALFNISLALLLMYSLRSSHILGWDINMEYAVFQATLQNLRWKMSYYPGLDYNACISITILPTIIKVLTNTSSEYVFKATFQLFFAASPVIVYMFAKRYLSDAFAFLAGFLFASQTWFFEQMPALIRQEIAFVFFALIVLVLFDRHLSARTRAILFYAMTVALILSHYSTVYVWLALMAVTLALSYGMRFFVKSLRGRPMVITPAMFIVTTVLIIAWQVPLTKTAGNLSQLFAGQPATAVASSTPATSNATSELSEIQDNSIAIDTIRPGFDTYPDAANSGYVPHPVTQTTSIASRIPVFASQGMNLLALASKFMVIDLFPLVGIVILYLGFRRRKENSEGLDLILLGTGAYALIVLMFCVPYLQEYYNFTRLYLQMFMILGTFSIVGGIAALRTMPRYTSLILGIVVSLIFCSLSGAFVPIVGGTPHITFSQPPSTLEEAYTSDAEVAGAEWLAAHQTSSTPIQADVVASMRLVSFANITSANLDIFPGTIQRESYVYLVDLNIAHDTAFYGENNTLLTYNYPLQFLNANKNLVYNDGDSRIYK